MSDIIALLREIEEVLARHQPELTATLLSDQIRVVGAFVCASDDGPFDRFHIEIAISSRFPRQEPSLEEVGGRIPRTVERHVFPSSGRCCLGLWEAWLLKTEVADFESYLLGPVTSYFISQWLFETTGDWPFGEQAHSTEAVAATYSESLGLPANADQAGYLRLLTSPLLTGNPVCPCGSGERLRNCHWKWIRERRRRIPASIRKDMAGRLRRAAKD
jgi:hypothetical protein